MKDLVNKLIEEYPVVTKAPANFFLAGEHSVMFGELAICQAIPRYVYIGLKRASGDNVYVKPAVYPNPITMEPLPPIDLPRMDQCMIEKLLWANNFRGLEIKILSEAPRGCGLATSGALGAALSLAVIYMFSNKQERNKLLLLQQEMENGQRVLKDVQNYEQFSRVWPLAWKIDALFHDHASSGANAFFALVGSPAGLPGIYRGALREGDFVPQKKRKKGSPFPLRAFNEKYSGCEYYKKTGCKKPYKSCPSFTGHYSLYDELPFSAAELYEWDTRMRGELFKYAVAICYCGELKRTDEVIRKVVSRAKLLKEMKNGVLPRPGWEKNRWETLIRSLGISAEELLNYILAPCGDEISSQQDVFRVILSIQSKLRYDICVSCDEIDDICEVAQKSSCAAKLTGAGFGGDVVIFGKTKTSLRNFLEKLVITRKDEKYKPAVHLDASCWSEGDLVTSPASFVRYEPRNIVFKCDVSENCVKRKEVVISLNKEKHELLERTKGQEIHSGGDGFIASFTCSEDAVEMGNLLYRRIYEVEKKAILRMGVYTGVNDYYGTINPHKEAPEIGHVTHIEESLKEIGKENYILICKDSYEMLSQEIKEQFVLSGQKVRDEIVCYISQEPWMK